MIIGSDGLEYPDDCLGRELDRYHAEVDSRNHPDPEESLRRAGLSPEQVARRIDDRSSPHADGDPPADPDVPF